MTALITDPVKIAAAGTTGGSGSPVPGDNTVALNLADLEKKSVLLGGKATFNDAYGQLVAKVGTLTHAAKIGSSAQEALLNQAKQARENLAGVNLDEEAANLIKFQQSYQAAAQGNCYCQFIIRYLNRGCQVGYYYANFNFMGSTNGC